ncbi:MAG TPA: hypothetical protein PKA17_07195 [Phenylobacterium sp.]|nr:hypothetical protein [Phenylobacterium sp.]
MTRKEAPSTARVQVYFENPRIERALRREANAAKIPLSRAAEKAIERGLLKRPSADPEDRLLTLERALRDHMRSTARDMSIVQELIVELARVFFLRLPDAPIDQDPLNLAACEVRVSRMLDAAAARLASGGSIDAQAPAEPPVFAEPGAAALEPRALQVS